MKATKAYIASLGTTGVLLAASILMLAVVSAVVAFDRWPTGHVSTRVQTLVLSEKPAPIRVNARAAGVSPIVPARSAATAAPIARVAPTGPATVRVPALPRTTTTAPAKTLAPLPAAVSK